MALEIELDTIEVKVQAVYETEIPSEGMAALFLHAESIPANPVGARETLLADGRRRQGMQGSVTVE